MTAWLSYLYVDELHDLFSAIINRCGFNGEGIVAVAKRLGAQHGKRKMDETLRTSSTDEIRHGGKAGPGILGVNLGKNKTSEDAAADYVQGVHTLSQYADYLVIILDGFVHILKSQIFLRNYYAVYKYCCIALWACGVL